MVAINERFHGFFPDRWKPVNVNPRASYTTHRNRLGDFYMGLDPLARKVMGDNTPKGTPVSNYTISQELYGKVVTVEKPLDNFGLYITVYDEAKKILDSLEKLRVLSRIGQSDLVHPRIMIEDILEQNIINAAEAVANRWGKIQNVGGQITISAFIQGEKLNLQVSDNGPGFPEAIIHEIGKIPFIRTSNPLTDKFRIKEGEKNHLYLTSQRMKEFGWELVIENLSDGGSVSVIIPLN